jgi:hypothetical protein
MMFLLLSTSTAQVRATPGSGKTGLAKLLYQHIRAKEPLASAHYIETWILNDDIYAKYPSHADTNTYLLFDDGQDTYADQALWNGFFKNISTTGYYAILFCSYGSPAETPVNLDFGTSLVLVDAARISLWPTEEQVGVLLAEKEFNEVVERFPEKICLDDALRREIFDWTNGHIGAVSEILTAISHKACSV